MLAIICVSLSFLNFSSCFSSFLMIGTKVLKNMLKPNLALISQRQTYGHPFRHALATDSLSDLNVLSNLGGGTVFPLYNYSSEPILNIHKRFLDDVKIILGFLPGGESIFYYIYGVLYSNTYRNIFKASLQSDYPRIPFPTDPDLFIKISALGEILVNLHLARSTPLKVNQPEITPEIENYIIGTYPVLKKWKKERQNILLNEDENKYYGHIAEVIRKTIRLENELNSLIDNLIKNSSKKIF